MRKEDVRVVPGLDANSRVQQNTVTHLDAGVALTRGLGREALVSDRDFLLREGSAPHEQDTQAEQQS